MALAVGDRAPAVRLPDQTGSMRTLAEAKGSWVLVYFYPKDDTPGCTAEACGLRDAWAEVQKAGLRVYGVSVDSVASHGKFAKKYRLPFPILADPEKRVVRAYGVWGKKSFMGRTYEGTRRTSFLIGPQGRIVKIYPRVDPKIHAAEVLRDLHDQQR